MHLELRREAPARSLNDIYYDWNKSKIITVKHLLIIWMVAVLVE